MTRKPWIPVLLALAAALLLLLVIQGGGKPDLGKAPVQETAGSDDAGHEPGPAQRAPVELREDTERTRPVTGTSGTGAAAPDHGADGGTQGAAGVSRVTRGDNVLRLKVHDQVTREPLASFRYIWIQDGERSTGNGENGEAEVEVTLDRPGRVVVESHGHQPDSRSQVTVRAGAGATELMFYLAPLPDLIGVELTARDPQGTPVPHVRVDAWRLDHGEEAEQALQRAALWSRRASDDGGNYRLPELQPGRYHLRVRALTEDGEERPLLPYAVTLVFHGSEHLPLFADLRPGALLALDVVDATGNPMGAGTGIRVTFPGGAVRDVTWIVESEGARLAASGGLPAAGTARASEPLPPGRYRLEFFTDGELRHTVWLDLAAGERRTEVVVLPSRR